MGTKATKTAWQPQDRRWLWEGFPTLSHCSTTDNLMWQSEDLEKQQKHFVPFAEALPPDIRNWYLQQIRAFKSFQKLLLRSTDILFDQKNENPAHLNLYCLLEVLSKHRLRYFKKQSSCQQTEIHCKRTRTPLKKNLRVHKLKEAEKHCFIGSKVEKWLQNAN